MKRFNIQAVGIYGYLLVMNPMMGNTESKKEFGPFDDKETLMTFYNSQKVEMYKEEAPNLFDGGTKTYTKSFAKGGPLEDMNPLMDLEFETPGPHGHGVWEVLLSVEQVVKIGDAF